MHLLPETADVYDKVGKTGGLKINSIPSILNFVSIFYKHSVLEHYRGIRAQYF